MELGYLRLMKYSATMALIRKNNMAAGLNEVIIIECLSVANKEFGGDDGRGGYYTYPNGQTLWEDIRNLIRHGMPRGSIFDWSQGRNSLPGEWRLPTKKSVKIIYMTNVANFKLNKKKRLRELYVKVGCCDVWLSTNTWGNFSGNVVCYGLQRGILRLKKFGFLQATNSELEG
ncbi:MAG: hypothetical protein ACLU4N_04405 [Butyricimonas faecihominis]